MTLTIAACSGVQPTPLQPSYPARLDPEDGVSFELDRYCRQHAYQAGQQTKQNNVAGEVTGALVGALLGAAVGSALSEPGYYYRHGRHGHWHYRSGDDLAGPGAVIGGAAGAALGSSAVQDPQYAYDLAYGQCIEANRYRYEYR